MSADQAAIDLCADVVARAKAAGAEEAEAYLDDALAKGVLKPAKDAKAPKKTG